MKNRLSKVIAACGVASRRKAEELIMEGHVRVNSQTVTLPQTPVELGVDRIEVKGKPLKGAEGKVIYLLNKPRGFICSSTALPGEHIVLDLFPSHEKRRLFTVGRLDKETSGLLIVTNDGHFAQKLIHPSSKIEKEYLVKTTHPIRDEQFKMICQGSYIEGTFIKPIRVTFINNYTVKIAVTEGKKHEVRLLVSNARLKIDQLKRIRIGNLHLGKLPLGIPRPIKPSELRQLF
ncbi:MAG: rRNA pseudouridine synthase [Simkaniaceae bacterium]|nr:rRNA pseudouridine synthase [Simkaniaceae bacterium]MCF7852576.1 rRNA pseudouridine synthase [Simkaniaceae bacterium]